ncbi:unnamed protein product, partial [marine sediment metagenome]
PTSSMLRSDFWYAYKSPKKDSIEKVMKGNLVKITKQKEECREKIRQQETLFHTLDGGEQALKEIIKITKLKERGAQL